MDPIADLSQDTAPYVYCVNNPILFTDKFGLDTGKIHNHNLNEVHISAKKVVEEFMDVALYLARPMPMPRYPFLKPTRTDNAGNFDDMAHNAIITYSSKTILTGSLLDKLKKDPAFQAWRKKILAQYKTNPQLKKYFTTIKFGGEKFFSSDGDSELKLSVRGAGVNASIEENNGSITISYQMNDTFDLDYQAGRGAVYNGINGILKPIWIGVLDGRDDMKVEAHWDENVKK